MNVRRTRQADLATLTGVHAAAFAGQLGPLLGRGYLEGFLSWFIDRPGAVSLVAEEDGAVLGYVFGAADGYGAPLGKKLRLQVAAGILRNLPRVALHPNFRRKLIGVATRILRPGAAVSPIFRATPSGCFCLVGIGTDPQARGRGVGRALIQAFCDAAPRRPIILDVYRDNAPARALYERCGFTTLAEEGRVLRMLRPA